VSGSILKLYALAQEKRWPRTIGPYDALLFYSICESFQGIYIQS
jgi:hypothetical protein